MNYLEKNIIYILKSKIYKITLFFESVVFEIKYYLFNSNNMNKIMNIYILRFIKFNC